MSKSTKTILIVVAIAAAAGLAYYLWRKRKPAGTVTTATSWKPVFASNSTAISPAAIPNPSWGDRVNSAVSGAASSASKAACGYVTGGGGSDFCAGVGQVGGWVGDKASTLVTKTASGIASAAGSVISTIGGWF